VTNGPHMISVIAPVYNEQENLRTLCANLRDSLSKANLNYEVILVNDGSRDNSWAVMKELAAADANVKVINLRRNSGQTAALMCAIDHARGDIIVPIDADLQNDPADIPALLAKLDEGYDVVSGWRQNRQDAAIRRNFVSRCANHLISRISGVALRDYGCSLKAYRRVVLDGVRLYGEMHRFIPIYASWMGARIAEIPVSHHPRIHGKSSYGLERIAKVILDLLVVKFMDRYLAKPIYVFGGVGIISMAISFFCVAWALWLKLVDGVSLILTPLPLLAALTFLVGVISILLGLVSEILVRTYFESQGKAPYHVKERLNFTAAEPESV